MRRPEARASTRPRLAVLAALLFALGLLSLALARAVDEQGRAAPAEPPGRESGERAVPREPTVAGDGRVLRVGYPEVDWADSVAVGEPEAGRLIRGVKLPREGRDFTTWDPITHARPSRGWRRHGTDRLVRTMLGVLAAHRRAFPGAPRVAIGDLSRPRGGDFGPKYGGVGHASHQNGLDADVYYPRLDRALRPPRSVNQVDLVASQDLVDRFVAAGAEKVFVGPNTGLTGPPGVVQVLALHDNHLHVRIPSQG